MKVDINCDLGEGESLAKTRALMRHITSANIACGGHAGDAQSMRECLRLARELKVRAGAHPGLYDRENFGRAEQVLSERELETLLTQQVGALALLAGREKVTLSHIKLHGALYHMAEKQAGLARTLVDWAEEYFPELEIYSLPGGRVAKLAGKAGVRFRGEIYADRGYLKSGALVPRGEPGAVLTDLDVIEGRFREWIRSEEMTATDGVRIKLGGETICVHSDAPNAVQVAALLKKVAGRK